MSFGVGLLGVGGWGANHLKALVAMRDAGLVRELVVCDVDAARAQAAAKEAGCDALTSPDALLRDPRVQAVDIVTPTPTHHDLAHRTLAAGKHVLVEKPMTERLAQAKELVALAERTGLTLMPGHLFRYHGGVKWLRAALARGELGDVRYLTVARQAFREPRTDMGVLLALGIHELDLFCHLLGKEYPDALQCTTAGWQQPGIDEVCWLDLRFGSVQAHATESWASPWAGKERFLAAFGSKGAARVDFLIHDRVEVWRHAYEPRGKGFALRTEGAQTIEVPFQEPLRAELEDFVRCAATGAKPLADMGSGLRGVAMLEACVQSAREGKVVAPRG